jgi:hypothetical protein
MLLSLGKGTNAPAFFDGSFEDVTRVVDEDIDWPNGGSNFIHYSADFLIIGPQVQSLRDDSELYQIE